MSSHVWPEILTTYLTTILTTNHIAINICLCALILKTLENTAFYDGLFLPILG